MSTLKTHNLQSPDAGSVNIVMAPNAGMVVAGISTFNNKVLIGTNTVGDSTADDLTIETSGSTGITLRSDSGYAGNIQFADGTSGDDQQRGIIQYHHSDNSMRFFTDAVRRLTITSSGHVGIGTNAPVGGSYLHIHGAGASDKNHIRLTADRGLIARLGDTSGGAQAMFDLYGTDGSTQIVRFISGGGVNFINTGGNLGIGTDSPDQMVHIHKGSAGSVSSTATSVLTLENSTTAVLQFLTPNTVSAQLRFGDPQDNGAGFIDYSHSSNTMAFGVYGPTRMQLDSNGHLGIAVASVTQLANSKQLTLRPTDDDGIRFVRPGDGNNNPNVHLDLTTTTSGSAYPSGEAYTVKYRTYNCDQIFETYEGGGTGGHIAFKTAPQGGTTTERLLINEDGQVTTPAQPSFAAYRNQSDWNVNNNYMVFNTTRHNVGGHYSTSNGRFTAPVAGSYYISFWAIYKNNYTNAAVRMYVNGSRIYGGDIHWTRDDLGSNWDHVSYSQVVYMNANDYIQILSASNVTWHGNHWQCYSGYLLG